MDERGERENGIRTDFRTEHRRRLQFQGAGARPWFLERCSGLVRGIYNRFVADYRSSSRQILDEVLFRLGTLLSASGYLAYQMVSGSSPADLHEWKACGGGLLFAQETSISGQFAQRWKLRMTAQEAALEEMTDSKLRRLLARIRSFEGADARAGYSARFYESVKRKSAPRRFGPAAILDFDDTGVTATF